jgi:hypothetical protein
MAYYLMTIKSLEKGNWKPPVIFIGMNDPFIGANTWSIDSANNWIGIGKGEYKVTGFNHDSLSFYQGMIGDSNSFVRFEFHGINYPSDLKADKFISGKGTYSSSYNQGTLEWSTRNIIPDEQ